MILAISTSMLLMMKHPTTMGLILLIHTSLMALSTGKMSMNFFYSYMMFIIMVGGLLILFIYMTSISANIKFKPFNKNLLYFIPLLPLIMKINSSEMNYIKINEKYQTINKTLMNKMINFPSTMMYLMLTIYLLISLIAIIKMISKSKSPLRTKK